MGLFIFFPHFCERARRDTDARSTRGRVLVIFYRRPAWLTRDLGRLPSCAPSPSPCDKRWEEVRLFPLAALLSLPPSLFEAGVRRPTGPGEGFGPSAGGMTYVRVCVRMRAKLHVVVVVAVAARSPLPVPRRRRQGASTRGPIFLCTPHPPRSRLLLRREIRAGTHAARDCPAVVLAPKCSDLHVWMRGRREGALGKKEECAPCGPSARPGHPP